MDWWNYSKILNLVRLLGQISSTPFAEGAPRWNCLNHHSNFLSLQTGKLPADLTKANVMHAFKKGDKSLVATYKLISLPCILCKVLEHILASNTVKHFDGQSILYDLQYGFREKRSCETQLIMRIEDGARSASVVKQTDLILLDFSKAFDKVNRSKLLWKHSRSFSRE